MSDRKKVVVLAGVTTAALAAAAVLASLTIDPPPLPIKRHATDRMVSTPQTPAAVAPPATPAPLASAPPPASPKAVDPPTSKPATAASSPPVPAKQETVAPSAADPSTTQPIDLTAVPLDELRARAAKNELAAMDELGRRLLEGVGIAKDPQAGAGWLLRAAERGSAWSAFNIGVMYERGFVVERDSSKAANWYRKAADAGLAAAKHNLALLLRDGKGVPRDVNAAMRLLLSAANQGMAASMFSLGDIYERGDSGTKDPAAALAWFAIAGEFERQANRDADTTLAHTAAQRAQALKRTLSKAELERAQDLAQTQFKQIVTALSPPPPPAASKPEAPPAPLDDAELEWPKDAAEQIRAIQTALIELKRLRDKPDGTIGPLTRAAIRDFQKSIGMPQTGEPTRELYVALKSVRHDILNNSPLPAPPAAELAAPPSSPKPEPSKAEALKPALPPAPAPTAKPALADAKVDLGPAAPPVPPPTSADVAAAMPLAPAPEPAAVAVQTAKPAAPPVIEKTSPGHTADNILPQAAPTAPPASGEVAQVLPAPKPQPPKSDADAWPANNVERIKAIQTLLKDLHFYTKLIDGQASNATLAAIREYQRKAGLKETGEINEALFESLKDTRRLAVPAAK